MKNATQLKALVKNIAKDKGISAQIIVRYEEILETIKKSNAMSNHWKSYQKDFNYAKDIDFNDSKHKLFIAFPAYVIFSEVLGGDWKLPSC